MTNTVPSGSLVEVFSTRGIYLSHTVLCPLVNDWTDTLSNPNRDWGGVIPKEYLEEVKAAFSRVATMDEYIDVNPPLRRLAKYIECWERDITLIQRPHHTRRGKHHRMRTGGLIGEAV